MNARHMSLIAGFYILLVGAGLSVIQNRMRSGQWVAAVLALVLLGGSAYSTFNYYADDDGRRRHPLPAPCIVAHF